MHGKVVFQLFHVGLEVIDPIDLFSLHSCVTFKHLSCAITDSLQKIISRILICDDHHQSIVSIICCILWSQLQIKTDRGIFAVLRAAAIGEVLFLDEHERSNSEIIEIYNVRLRSD